MKAILGDLSDLVYLKSDDVKLMRIRQNNILKQIIFILIQLILILQCSISYKVAQNTLRREW